MKCTPDLILYSGRIHTRNNTTTPCTAIAVAGRKIAAIGPDRDILAMASDRTRTINLENRLVLPGFCDTHFHFYEWALNFYSIDFSCAHSLEQVQSMLSRKILELEKGRWITGYGLNESAWPEKKLPDRSDLDRCAPDNPVCIFRCDLHLCIVNSMALDLAGIGPDTADPENGIIEKDGSGAPTGILRELAPNLIRRVMPEISEDAVADNMCRAMSCVHELGITSVHDIRLMGGLDNADALRMWQRLHREGRMKIRCHAGLAGEMTDQAIELGLCTGFGDDLLKIGHLKFFADGGMGARTAWMTQKYLDAEYGMPLTPVREIEDAALRAEKAGLSIMVHAIGDRANREIIDMFHRIGQQRSGSIAIPHRIEHMQMVLPEDVEKLKTLENTAVSCQPNNIDIDISMIEKCSGPRGKYAYNLKSILDTGIALMLSSDAPVADKSPLFGIYSAVTRKKRDKTPASGWYPEQALSVEQAVRAYTLTPAEASGISDVSGSLAPGRLADMTVLDRDIFSVPCDEIADIRVDMTIFNGKTVYERK